MQLTGRKQALIILSKWLPVVLCSAIWSTMVSSGGTAAAAIASKQASVISSNKLSKLTILSDPFKRHRADDEVSGSLQRDQGGRNDIAEDISNSLPRGDDSFDHDNGESAPPSRRPITEDSKTAQTSATTDKDNELINRQHLELTKWFDNLQQQFVQQVLRQRVAEKDHLMMQKWLVDNINDLHRELKQTESDFEHYVQVTKSLLLAGNEQRLMKQQLARATRLPLSIPIYDPQTGI